MEMTDRRHSLRERDMIRIDSSSVLPRTGGTFQRACRAAVVGLCVLVLGACGTPGFDLSESKVQRLSKERAKASVQPAFTQVERTPYEVQPGDRLGLQFFFNPDLNLEVRVQPDGAVTIPLLGTRSVRGMTIPELTELVRSAYARELNQPQVVVQLLEASARQVYVGGAVNTPREIAYRAGITPLEVIFAAGGFASTAKANQVVVIRKDLKGRPIPSILDLDDMVMQADASGALQPWDIVFVPKSEMTKATEWVDLYLRKLLLFNGISFGYQLNPDRGR